MTPEEVAEMVMLAIESGRAAAELEAVREATQEAVDRLREAARVPPETWYLRVTI